MEVCVRMDKCADAVREKSSLADFLQINSHLESLDMSFQICTSLRQHAQCSLIPFPPVHSLPDCNLFASLGLAFKTERYSNSSNDT